MYSGRTVLVALAALLGASGTARAANMEPTPDRLVLQPPGLPPGQTCQSVAANPGAIVTAGLRPQSFPCRPDNHAFFNMMGELGFAIAPNAFYPARTTGIAGLVVSVEASYTHINRNSTSESGTPYWKLGTRGGDGDVINDSPDSVIQIYGLKIRKGLGFGFELAGALGTISGTKMLVGGGDVRWSLMEGFRTGPLGYVPDLSIGTGVRTVTGTSKFYLTTVGIDVKLSKPFTLPDGGQIIPTLGFQRLLIFADSTVLDGTPNTDALAQCGYQGPDPQTGTPTCANKLPNGADANTDFVNNFTFSKVRVHRSRGLIGAFYKYEHIWAGTQMAFDLTSPGDENALVGSRQWTLSFEGGVSF